MYSGTTLRRGSGRIIGVHQKIDRIAKRQLKHALRDTDFPAIQEILHFEGMNGPDGIKRKSPAQDELWHYVDPSDPNDTELLDIIRDHSVNLARALRDNNRERAAFEAAWLAHAIVDGLTPAHHYPLQEKLEQLRGEGLETRTDFKKKIVMPGKTRREKFSNNWQYWGAKGVMTTHALFEFGVATTIAPHRLRGIRLTAEDLKSIEQEGIIPYFRQVLQTIDELKMYEAFQRVGWSQKLARQTREILIPEIIKTVALAWYSAAYDVRVKGK